MHPGLGRDGMGDFDWGAFANQALQTAGGVISNAIKPGTGPVYGGGYSYPAAKQPVGSVLGGMDMTTILLVGIGAFLLVKAMK